MKAALAVTVARADRLRNISIGTTSLLSLGTSFGRGLDKLLAPSDIEERKWRLDWKEGPFLSRKQCAITAGLARWPLLEKVPTFCCVPRRHPIGQKPSLFGGPSRATCPAMQAETPVLEYPLFRRCLPLGPRPLLQDLSLGVTPPRSRPSPRIWLYYRQPINISSVVSVGTGFGVSR